MSAQAAGVCVCLIAAGEPHSQPEQEKLQNVTQLGQKKVQRVFCFPLISQDSISRWLAAALKKEAGKQKSKDVSQWGDPVAR